MQENNSHKLPPEKSLLKQVFNKRSIVFLVLVVLFTLVSKFVNQVYFTLDKAWKNPGFSQYYEPYNLAWSYGIFANAFIRRDDVYQAAQVKNTLKVDFVEALQDIAYTNLRGRIPDNDPLWISYWQLSEGQKIHKQQNKIITETQLRVMLEALDTIYRFKSKNHQFHYAGQYHYLLLYTNHIRDNFPNITSRNEQEELLQAFARNYATVFLRMEDFKIRASYTEASKIHEQILFDSAALIYAQEIAPKRCNPALLYRQLLPKAEIELVQIKQVVPQNNSYTTQLENEIEKIKAYLDQAPENEQTTLPECAAYLKIRR